MPKINVYLSDELADAVKEAYLPVSAICQRALETAVRRVSAIREATVEGGAAGRFARFTARAQAVLALAEEDARNDGTAVGTHHLLAALVAEGGNLAVKLMPSMDIEPLEVTAAVAGRRPAPTGGDGPGGFAPDAQAALHLTVTEAAGLGHNFVGCEHLLLGLIAEPDGLGGQILRGMGAELRLTRRAVAGALMGWAHRGQVQRDPASPDIAVLAATLREQLAPILTRLDRLEERLAG
jgi:ATP-dependent Clp protease ATP-binding subunit ClpA